MKRIITLVAILLVSVSSFAQKASLSTNFIDWAYMGTANLDLGVSVAQHLTLQAGANYNPWKFENKNQMPLFSNQTTGYLGLRYWFWYSFSGWYLQAKGQYSKFDECCVWRIARDTGQAVGGGLSFGYVHMLSPHFNLEFGLGAWCGKYLNHEVYHCSNCMELVASDNGFFVLPDDLSISLVYVF